MKEKCLIEPVYVLQNEIESPKCVTSIVLFIIRTSHFLPWLLDKYENNLRLAWKAQLLIM